MKNLLLFTILYLDLISGLITKFHLKNKVSPIKYSEQKLFAKKKLSKLLSEDFLSSLDSLDNENSDDGKSEPPALQPQQPKPSSASEPPPVESSNKKQKQLSKKEKKLAMFGLLDNEETNGDSESGVTTYEIDFEKEQKKLALANNIGADKMQLEELLSSKDSSKSFIEPDTFGSSKKNKKNKNKGSKDSDSDYVFSSDESKASEKTVEINEDLRSSTDDDDDDDSESNRSNLPSDGLTIEQRIRKEKPPPRVRFAESSQPDFAMMELDKVSVVFGNAQIIKDASFDVKTGERVGLVGPNGGGKTTLLKIFAEALEPTTGDLVKSSKNLRTAYLRQEFIDELVPERTLKEELYSAFTEENEILNAITACEEEISQSTEDPLKMEEVLNRLAELQQKANTKGVYSLESRVEKIMDSTGFSGSDASSLVKSFSGGWKMRIGLAKILLKDPNVLLLDEPTNHLDLESVLWLEGFLQKVTIPLLIVSHDREFLDKVCNKIVDVEDGITVVYQGNYSKFILTKRERLDQWRDKYDKQLRYVKEEEKYIKKAKNDPNMAQQVKSKEMALEKFKSSEDYVKQPPKEKRFRFRFPPAPRCGTSVLEVNKLSHGYGEGRYKVLFDNVNIQVDRGNRVGFVGPNGSGKSTLMRIISGMETSNSGTSEFGSSNVQFNYFAQSQADTLDLERSVLETVQEDSPPEITLTEIRNLLGQFMFKGDDVDKKVKYLSGGEKARVSLCKMMLTPANLLLLDEPTNHLDITSKEVLEDAIQNFEGSVLVISHDRYFLSQIANTIFSFEDRRVIRHDCDYHDFMNRGEKSELKAKVEARYVENDKYRITNAKQVVIVEDNKKKKNFGGSGVTSGDLFKGIKNAKRFQN